jgi:hypothetical protein
MTATTMLLWSLGVSGAVIAVSGLAARLSRRDHEIDEQVCPHCRMPVPVAPIHGDGFTDFICTRCYTTIHLHIYGD